MYDAYSGQGYVDQPGRREERATKMNDGDGGERQAMVDLRGKGRVASRRTIN